MSKKPQNTAFKQQRLKSWQPLLIPKTVIPVLFFLGVVFIPVGVALFIAANNVNEVVLDYTNCINATDSLAAPSFKNTGINKWKYDPTTNICLIEFNVPAQITAPVYIYYRLSNFYQNNRKYVSSFDLHQLSGATPTKLSPSCEPVATVKAEANVKVALNGVSRSPAEGAVYYPCGLVANSQFSDVISDLKCIQSDYKFNGAFCNSTTVNYMFSATGIAWPADAQKYGDSKYKDLPEEELNTKVIPPPFWQKSFPKWKDGYNKTNFPDLATDERFQVWMRTAGLPTFRKLWGVQKNSLLPSGTWQLEITQQFDTNKFGGTKSIVISSASLLGGKNTFLGSAYVLVGCLCVGLGVAFLIRNLVKPRKLGDHLLLSWNQTPANAEQNAALLGQNH
ncbi:CDC50/LEM3 family [Globomyces pollinis-pini]|nr:CDC50/LEM3 family [Globomyces pollinis-pini]